MPFCGYLEDELEGELHLPAPLLTYIAPEFAFVIEVGFRRRTIHSIQHVVRGESELNIERFANRADREILEERRIPVKLLPPTKDVTSE